MDDSIREQPVLEEENQLTDGTDSSKELVESGEQRREWKFDDYSTLKLRISSFVSWPASANETPQKLAEAGFFYTGVRDKVRCFNCGRCHEKWAVNDDPWYIHVKMDPVCKFMRQIKGKLFTDKAKPVLSNRFESMEARIETFKDWPTSANISFEELAKAGFYYTGEGDLVRSYCCGGSRDNWQINDEPWLEHAKFDPVCEFIRKDDSVPYYKVKVLLRKKFMTKESRLSTFGTWTAVDIITPEELAEAGFFYTGYKDMVRCHYCGTCLQNWAERKNPYFYHITCHPWCEFIHQVEGKLHIDRMKVVLRNLYSTEESRIRSYKSWPCSANKSPQELAKAGFYYTGVEDSVRCFQCNYRFDKWEVEDDPWFEHAKCDPLCDFIRQSKNKTVLRNRFMSEESRVASFKNWPTSANKTPEELAKAGFFYTGVEDLVQCFRCGNYIKEWKIDDEPWVEHAKFEPVCEFIRQAEGEIYLEKVKPVLKNKFKSVEMRVASFSTSWPTSFHRPAEEFAEAGFYYTGIRDILRCFYCNCSLSGWDEVQKDPWFEHVKLDPVCEFIRQVQNTIIFDRVKPWLREKYLSEKKRVATFKTWPSSANKTPNELVRAGFYYTGVDDAVRCFYCGFWREEWEVKDDLWFEHAKPQPVCEFIRQIEGKIFTDEVKPVLRDRFTTEESRIASFHSWPATANKMPEELVKAGYFYTGDKDKVRCFYCGFQISNWKIEHDPFFEHVKQNSSCEFVLQVKGENFVDKVEQKLETMKISSPEEIHLRTNDVSQQKCHDDIIETLMNSSMVKTVLQLGYDKSEIEQVIKHRIKRCESFFSSGKELLDAVFCAKSKLVDMNDGCLGPDESNITAYLQKLEEQNLEFEEAKLCKICFNRNMNIVFRPCGHLFNCSDCAANLEDCPICRQRIEQKIPTFSA